MKLCERLGEYFIGGVVNNQVYPFYGHYRGDDKPHILQKYWVPDSIWVRSYELFVRNRLRKQKCLIVIYQKCFV